MRGPPVARISRNGQCWHRVIGAISRAFGFTCEPGGYWCEERRRQLDRGQARRQPQWVSACGLGPQTLLCEARSDRDRMAADRARESPRARARFAQKCSRSASSARVLSVSRTESARRPHAGVSQPLGEKRH